MSVDKRPANREIGKITIKDYQQVINFIAELRGVLKFVSALNDKIPMPNVKIRVPVKWEYFTDDEKGMAILEATVPLVATFYDIMDWYSEAYNIGYFVEEKVNSKKIILNRCIIIDYDTGWQKEASQLDYINSIRWVLKQATVRVGAKVGNIPT